MKRFLLIGMLLFSLHVSAQERGAFCVDATVGCYLNATIGSIDSDYENLYYSETGNLQLGWGVGLGLFITDHIKLGVGYASSSNTTNSESITSIKQISGSLAYYGEIVNGLYYVPELTFGIVGGEGMVSDFYYPLGGFVARLSLGQLEFKPTEHFSTSIDFGYIAMSAVAGSTTYMNENINISESMFTVSLGVSPTIKFKYYF